jgi:hypothetical protein
MILIIYVLTGMFKVCMDFTIGRDEIPYFKKRIIKLKSKSKYSYSDSVWSFIFGLTIIIVILIWPVILVADIVKQFKN